MYNNRLNLPAGAVDELQVEGRVIHPLLQGVATGYIGRPQLSLGVIATLFHTHAVNFFPCSPILQFLSLVLFMHFACTADGYNTRAKVQYFLLPNYMSFLFLLSENGEKLLKRNAVRLKSK